MGTKTPLMGDYQPGGAFSYADIKRHPAGVWFVGSTVTGASDTAGFGYNPDKPAATLDYINSVATASAGDVVYLLPGHVETVTEAGGLDMDCIGLHVIGCGHGTLQPVIELTTIASADIDIDAASVTFENVHFRAGVADIVAAIDVNCADLTIRNCRFSQEDDDLNALIWIQDHATTTTSNRITVEDCIIYAYDASNTHFINYSGTGDGHIFRRNVLIGDWGTMAVGGAGVITNANISDNYIYNAANTANGCLNFDASATGVMMNNRVGNAAVQNSQITATGMSKNENYACVVAEDLNGILEPAGA